MENKCNEGGQAAMAPEVPADGSAAATVNGEALPTAVLTRYIDGVRAGIGSQTDLAWEAYLRDHDHTPDSYWAALIAHYGREMAVTQRCDALGIEAAPERVEERVAQTKRAIGADTEQGAFLWDAYLKRYGYTERTVRRDIAYHLRRQALYEREVPREEGMDGAAWKQACDRYVQGLFERADVQVLVAHQYDVPGQRHGNAGAQPPVGGAKGAPDGEERGTEAGETAATPAREGRADAEGAAGASTCEAATTARAVEDRKGGTDGN